MFDKRGLLFLVINSFLTRSVVRIVSGVYSKDRPLHTPLPPFTFETENVRLSHFRRLPSTPLFRGSGDPDGRP